jgi:hypothetical protein
MRHRRLAAFALVCLTSLVLPAGAAAASPIAGNDQVATNEETPVLIDLLKNDSDPDGDALHLVSVNQIQNGRVTLTDVPGVVSFAPLFNFNGTGTFSYVVADTGGATATGLVMVFVIGVNDPPIAAGRVYSVAEGGSVSVLLQGTDPDKERCDLTFVIDTPPAHGALGPLVDAGCNPNGDMVTTVYTPAAGYSGADPFTYHVSDGFVQSNVATASITVIPLPRFHVGDLDRATIKGSGSWTATATIRVETSAQAPQAGALVHGTWTSGLVASCTTSAAGTCTIGSGSIARSVKSTMFTVTSVAVASSVYDASANHDSDGDSDGTSITIVRP